MIEGLKPYGKYKDSGQGWLGNVPEHWTLAPGHSAFRARKESNRGLKEKTVLSLSYGRIKVKPTDKQTGLVPESYETYQVVDPGNIIIRGTDLQNDKTSLHIGLARDRGIISSAYLCLAARDTVIPAYGYEILNIFDLTKAIYRYGSGMRQNLDHGEIKRLPIFLPPIVEQAAIVRFLDHANRKIDSFIGAKRKLIALLNEQKQAIIHRAVTRGIHTDVPLKPSGIEWLGDIPAHWSVLRAKHVFKEIDERSVAGHEEQLSVSHLTGVTPRSEKNVTMFKAESYVGHKVCRIGDLAVNTMWAWMGALGISRHHGIISPAYAVYRQKAHRLYVDEYADLLLRTAAYRSNYLIRSTGVRASRLRLYPERFLETPLLIPPTVEQQEIVVWIRIEIEALEVATNRAKREIALMQEYRARLTANIVSGKLDVRTAAAKLPERVDMTANEPVVEETPDELELEDTE